MNPATALLIGITLLLYVLSCVAFFLYQQWRSKQFIQQRLKTFIPKKESQSQWQRLLERLPITDNDRIKLDLLLKQAGFRQPEAILYLVAAKLLGLIALPSLYLVFSDQGLSTLVLAKATITAFFGSMAAEWWLKIRAQSNREQLRAATPDAVDLMVLCAESGLHMDAILLRVGNEIASWSPQLSSELIYTHAEIQVGIPRASALKHLADRVDSEEFHQLVNTLIQSDRLGTPLVKTLQDLAADVRRIRSLYLEEKMGKVPALMTLPLMLFVLLPLVVLLAAPSIIALTRSLQAG